MRTVAAPNARARMTTLVTTAAMLLGGLLPAGCAAQATHVASDDSALGRVVVYRNGIAYYERKAHVVGTTLTLTVPADKVDDFLKSLTVADAASGDALPVSFPTRGAAEDGKVDMTIQLPVSKTGTRDVVLTYITDSPAWKPSYRLVVGPDGEVNLQGWAIVDNTSGEDWRAVRVGVGSSSALSFRYDLRSVRTVHRETLRTDERFASAPPNGQSTWGGSGSETQSARVLGSLADADLPAPDGHPMREDLDHDMADATISLSGADSSASPSSRAADAKRKKDLDRRRAQHRQVAQLAKELQRSGRTVVIEGYAAGGETDPDARAAERANRLRNELIRNGVAPARLKVQAQGVVRGQGPGVRLVEERAREKAAETQAETAEGADTPVGESHFESKSPMTVAGGTSAMVAILDEKASGDIVYLFDPEAERGDDRFAFKAVRLVNPTDSTLETGPVTVYGDGRFVGEGMTNPVPPRATAVIPFALDRQIVVERSQDSGDRIAKLMTLHRGVLTTEVKHRRTTKLHITSRLHADTTVFIRHNVRKGWTLAESPDVYERFGESHLFAVDAPARETLTIEIVETTPLVRTVDLRSPVGIELMAAWIHSTEVAAGFAEPMKQLMNLHGEIHDIRESIGLERDRMAEYRTRMGELHTQIVSLKRVRGGASLMRHLQSKMKDMSNRVQKATIHVVDLQEQLMLTRIRFQDGIAELTLADGGSA